MIEYPRKVLLATDGTEDSSRAGRATMGRAADTIARSAHCPVLVVRGDSALGGERFG